MGCGAGTQEAQEWGKYEETPGVTGKFGLGIQEPSRIIEMKNTVAELKTK